MILSTALVCLAANVYFEARGESEEGQKAVAQVTLNRVMQDGDSVCTEVTKYKQFSWTTGKIHKVKGVWYLAKAFVPSNKKAWNEALRIAKETLSGRCNRLQGATFYHAKYVAPDWAEGMTLVATIGQHRFYKIG